MAGGIKNLEITFNTPGEGKVIKRLKNKYENDASVIIGAGSVMNLSLAKEVYKAGAEFLVSPHFSLNIAKYAKKVGVSYIPGSATVTEIVKVFPGGILAPKFIKDVCGPLPEIQLMPSGGVSLNNITDWKSSGAVAVGIGSALTNDVETKGYNSVTNKTKKFIDCLA